MRCAALCLCIALAPLAANAQENCPALKQVAHIPLVRSRDGQSWAPVLINNIPRLLKLDTGGVITSVFQEAADDLKLPVRRSRLTLVDVDGNVSNRSAHAQTLDMGELHYDSALDFMVLPSRNPGYAGNKRAGYLALDLLKRYDIELDFAANTMNLFSPEHCAGRVVYWPAETVSEIPISFDSQGKLRVPVKLDGIELSAVLDTGSSGTVLNMSVGTKKLNLDLNAPDVQKFGPEGRTIYRKRFATLEMSGLFVANPFAIILPDKMGDAVRAASERPSGVANPFTGILSDKMGDTVRARPISEESRLPDLLIGTSILNKLHIYLATKEKKLYVSAAMPPSANANPAPQIPEGGT